MRLALVVLLASATFAAADLVATDTYKCDPTTCTAPTCQCATNTPPGNLTADQIPQFVLISHDNALDSLPYELLMGVLGNKSQANGCNVSVTWFAMFYHSDCIAGIKALARGDEVAMQTNRFNPTDPFTATDPAEKYDSRDPKTGEPSVAIEITMSRKHWNEYCKIPLREMVGFRAPNYYNNPPIRKALSENGYLYDATLIERWYTNNPTSPSEDKMLWPYTMDAGIPQECNFMGDDVGSCKAGENYSGLWEVPLYQAQEGDTMYGVSGYGITTAGLPAIDDMEQFLKDQLDSRLANGRSPMQISLFYEWLAEKEPIDPACDNAGCERAPNANAAALSKFLDYALKKPEVRFVRYSDLIRWMQDPVPLDKFDDWIQCSVPGIKADLTAVNLTAADKAGAWYLTQDAAPAPAPAPVEVPAPAPAPLAAPVAAPAPAPVVATLSPPVALAPPTVSTPPVGGASTLSAAVAAAAAALGALLLTL